MFEVLDSMVIEPAHFRRFGASLGYIWELFEAAWEPFKHQNVLKGVVLPSIFLAMFASTPCSPRVINPDFPREESDSKITRE